MLPPQLPQLWPPLACVLKFKMCPGPVAGASNPSHLGGRDQEDCSLKQPRQIIHETLSWKYLSLKKSWWSDSRCRPWVQTPVLQKKKKFKMEIVLYPKKKCCSFSLCLYYLATLPGKHLHIPVWNCVTRWDCPLPSPPPLYPSHLPTAMPAMLPPD
jgi:hypothetical protein